MRILVTGGAGFIGSALTLRLLSDGHSVVVVDDLNEYYDPSLKRARIARFGDRVPVRIVSIADSDALDRVFALDGPFDAVAHLAAQAGVRYSLTNPEVYARSNYLGTQNVLESVRNHGVPHVVFASTSSVYGSTKDLPFTEDSRVDTPLSIYAASKRAGELLASTYAHLFGINVTALRFFTVYGPWGRPDMALFGFTKAILEGTPVELFNGGDMKRDFTYIDDIVDGFTQALAVQLPGFEIINLGHGSPVHLRRFLEVIEQELGKKAKIIEKPLQPGDMLETYADTKKARALLGFAPQVPVEEGVKRFVSWYRGYHQEHR